MLAEQCESSRISSLFASKSALSRSICYRTKVEEPSLFLSFFLFFSCLFSTALPEHVNASAETKKCELNFNTCNQWSSFPCARGLSGYGRNADFLWNKLLDSTSIPMSQCREHHNSGRSMWKRNSTRLCTYREESRCVQLYTVAYCRGQRASPMDGVRWLIWTRQTMLRHGWEEVEGQVIEKTRRSAEELQKRV